MKKIRILYKTILVMLLIVICSSCVCYAMNVEGSQVGGNGSSSSETGTKSESEGKKSDTTISPGLPNLNGDYKPTAQLGDKATNIVSSILSILTVLGMVVAVIGIALVGFNTILGSASEKAAGQEKYVGIIVAALLITSGSAIAKFIINFAEKAI